MPQRGHVEVTRGNATTGGRLTPLGRKRVGASALFSSVKRGRHSARRATRRRPVVILAAFAAISLVAAGFFGGGAKAARAAAALASRSEAVSLIQPLDATLTPTVILNIQSEESDGSGGEFVIFAATVSGPSGDPVPTGMVTVSDGVDPTCPIALDSTGSGTCQIDESSGGGPFTITADYSGDGSYVPLSGTMSTVQVTDTSAGVETGGSFAFTATVTSSTGIPTGTVIWLVNGPGSPTCPDSTLSGGQGDCIINDAEAGSYTATATYTGDSTYVGSSGSDSAAGVAKADLTITASSTSTTYGTGPIVTASFSPPEGASSLTTEPTCSSTVTATSDVGSYSGANTCEGAVSSDYAISYVSGDAAVTKASLTVTASSTSTIYGTVPTVAASYAGFIAGQDSGSLTTKPTCTSAVTDTTTAGTYDGANTCAGAVDGNYDISYVAGDATVTKATLTITASPTSTAYGSSPTVTASYSPPGGASSLTTAPTCSSTVTGTSNAGTYHGANTCEGASSSDYEISYVSGDATVTKDSVTVTASSSSSTYGLVPSVTASYSGFVNGQGAGSLTTQATCSSAVTATTDVGTYTGANTCEGAVDPNYTFDYVAGEATVTKAELTITASSTSTAYGTSPSVTASYTGFPSGQGASSLGALPSCSSTVTDTTAVGSYAGANTCEGAVDGNYDISYVAGEATVTKVGLTITASSTSTTYGTTPTVTAGYSGFPPGQGAGSLTTAPTCSSTVTAATGVGTHTGANTCEGAVDGNYDISYVAGEATVTKASLTITASGGSMSYGGTPPTVTASYGGFVNGESSSSLTTAPTCSTVATITSPAGSYASSCSGASDPNYTISYVPGSVTVNPVALTITASDATTTYGTPPAVTAKYSGFVNGDTASSLTTKPSCTSTATGSSPVGDNYTSSCSGASDPSYTISYLPGSVKVTPAALTITASSPSFTYGGTPPTITAVYSGFVNGDTSTSLTTQPTCSTAATSTSPAGSYASTCSGAADANYTITYAVGSVTISKATPTVTVSGQAGQSTGPVTISVMVTGLTGATVPTGSVTVSDASDKCTITTLDATGSGTCALIENVSENGQSVKASYAGDTNYATATGTTTESVSVAAPTVSLSGPSSAVTGLINYYVTVSGKGASPTGSVTVTDGTNSCTDALNSKGIGSCQFQETTGTYEVTANYTGDTNYSSGTASATEVVNETTTSLVASTTTLVYGLEQTVTFSVVVYPPPGDQTAPAGATVDLMAGTQTLCVTSPLAPTTVTVTNPVSGLPVQVIESTATCQPAPAAIPAGTYQVDAEFAGESGSFVGSTSPPAPLIVESAPTTTTVSVSRGSTTYWKESAETLTAKVSETGAGSSLVTGTVTLKAGSTTLCKPTLKKGVGTCKLSRAQLAAGPHLIVADYQGSTSLLASSSKPLALLVAKALTTSALSLSRTTAAYGAEQSLKFTARVVVPAGMPFAGGSVVVMSGSKRLCVITLLHGTGSCALSASELTVGSHSVSADYQGSKELLASVSPGRTVTVTKAKTG